MSLPDEIGRQLVMDARLAAPHVSEQELAIDHLVCAQMVVGDRG